MTGPSTSAYPRTFAPALPRRHSLLTRLIDRVAAWLAIAGVAFAVVSGFQVAAWQVSASDIKTQYASAWCLTHGLDAYSFKNIGAVFAANHVVTPGSWYAHAPVYPPFTLAAMAPLTALPMVPAIYTWVLLSAVVLAAAAAALARTARDVYGLSLPWRLLIITLVAASPLVSFGIEMGNVSIMVSALCILVATSRDGAGSGHTNGKADSMWLAAAELALALLLKPHLALWIFVALLFLPWRHGRAICLRGAALAAGFCLAAFLWLAAHGQAMLQIDSYRAMVHAELNAGSMDMANHELIQVQAQITSLSSLFGYWFGNTPAVQLGALLCLAAAAALLVWASRREAHGSPQTAQRHRLQIISAWCLIGLLATYHRAHDAIVLVLLLPWIATRLSRRFYDPAAWSAFILSVLFTVSPLPGSLDRLAAKPDWHAVAEMLIYRQAPLAVALLCLLMVAVVAATAWSARAVAPRADERPGMLKAAAPQRAV